MRRASTGDSSSSSARSSARPVPRSARQLLAAARAESGEPAGEAPVIRGVDPSRAAWGEAIVISGDFSPGAPSRVALRSGKDVRHLTPRRPEGGRLRVTLPTAPAGGPDMLVAELFVVVGRESSRPCRIVIYNGPVLRQIRRGGENEWVLEGVNFGASTKEIKVETTGAPKARVLAVSNAEIRIRVKLADRAPVRVRVGGRVSNTLQVGRLTRGLAL